MDESSEGVGLPIHCPDVTTEEIPSTLELRLRARVAQRALHHGRGIRRGVRHPKNQRQLVRFLVVGATGYIVNTVSFFILLHAAGFDYKWAFVGAFGFGCANNFVWNRHWTFEAYHDHPVRQGVRFFLVSLIVALCAYGIMVGLVASVNLWKVPADAIAWIVVTPVSFVVQKLWSFKA